ncbi:DUF2304 domain-containing protein [Eisenbergiella tayi]|uniref:DUF2304 domain-containing protein n=1 Tax=Eisenbergiella tayi TaxID=1432052 RepID=UPI0008485D53|nr:DUF2304 domain-containing protein [Eisenbergiella tayi]ODR36020.1 hypothetical protein BEI60_15435 [Eisenbergiella tayi]
MSITLRIVLLLVAIASGIWILYKVHKSKLKMEDAIFWILSAAILFIMGLFPKVAYVFADFLGIESPSNFVFAFLIFVGLMKMLSLSIRVSQLEDRISVLCDDVAIRLHDIEEDKKDF